jgi:cell division transport system permease protein
MSLNYTLRETFSGFKRTKLASLGSIVTICIALLLLGVYYLLSLNAARVVQMIRDRVEVEAFCEEPLSGLRADELRQQLMEIEGVDSVYFVSKEEAARIFKEEFGQDIMNVLEHNPLPPSFKIFLKSEFKHSTHAERIVKEIKSFKGIDDVIYRRDLLEFLDRRMTIAHSVGLFFSGIIGLSAVFLVSNTIRLAIYAKRTIIKTMKLVGATRWFIRMPFLLEGVVHGALGGLLAAGMFYLIVRSISRWVSTELAEFIRIDLSFYGLLVGCGILLGLFGSLVSTRRYIGETVVS